MENYLDTQKQGIQVGVDGHSIDEGPGRTNELMREEKVMSNIL